MELVLARLVRPFSKELFKETLTTLVRQATIAKSIKGGERLVKPVDSKNVSKWAC